MNPLAFRGKNALNGAESDTLILLAESMIKLAQIFNK